MLRSSLLRDPKHVIVMTVPLAGLDVINKHSNIFTVCLQAASENPYLTWAHCGCNQSCVLWSKKGKVFPYSLPSVGPRADPGVQAVSPQVMWSESCHRPGLSVCSFHQMALPVNGCTHLIPAHFSFIDPEKMKGWVGLVGWPVADGLPTLVVRTGKFRQPETDVLPLCYATNWY